MDDAALAQRVAIGYYPHRYAHWVTRGQFTPYPHLRLVSRRIAEAVHEGHGRIIVNMPPRVGKTALMRAVLSWYVDHWPERDVILAGYQSEIAKRDAGIVRNLFESSDRTTTRLRRDSKAADRWNTTQGGGVIASGPDGKMTGYGMHLGIIDDPHKNWEEAHSHRKLEAVWEWFYGTLYQRLEPEGTIIVTHTRWNTQDLAGRLIEDHADDWTVISLPALAEPGDPLGRAPGESICEARVPRDQFERARNALPGHVWDAVFQQAPREVGAGHVFAAFDTGNVDQNASLQPGRTLEIGIDFNINPGMHATVGQSDRTEDRIWTTHVVHEPRMNLEQCCRAIADLVAEHGGWEQFGAVEVFPDATGKAREISTGASKIVLLRRHLTQLGCPNLKIRVSAKNPPIMSSVDGLNDAMRDVAGVRHYFVHPRCKPLLTDYRTLKTDQHGGIDKSDQDRGHAADCERYRVAKVRPLARIPDVRGRFAVSSG